MSYIEVWDESKPAGTRALNLGDDDIREFKRAIRERLAAGGMHFPSTDDSTAGLFDYVKFIEQSANPTVESNRGFLFTKDVSGVTELYWMDSSGNVFQLTNAGKVLLTSLGGYVARGDLIRGGASGWERLALGASATVLRSNGTDAAWAALSLTDLPAIDYTKLAVGVSVQTVNAQDGAVATGTTLIPYDDTIPQNTEGFQVMTLAITPKATSHKLKIEVVVHLDPATNFDNLCAALFQDSTAGALACGWSNTDNASTPIQVKFTHYMSAGTTSATTFKVRVGADNVGTITFNGELSARKFGGVLASSITITEVIA